MLIVFLANFVGFGGVMKVISVEIELPQVFDVDEVMSFTEVAVAQLRADLGLCDFVSICVKDRG